VAAVDASIVVVPSLAPGTRRLIVLGAARLVAVAALAGNAVLMWPLAVVEPALPVAAVSAVVVLACALGARSGVPALDLVAVVAGWLTAWASLRYLSATPC